jgi:hypothetical protein
LPGEAAADTDAKGEALPSKPSKPVRFNVVADEDNFGVLALEDPQEVNDGPGVLATEENAEEGDGDLAPKAFGPLTLAKGEEVAAYAIKPV